MAAYDDLIAKVREISLIETIGQIMNWDMEVYIPPAAFQQRGEQMAMLQRLQHRLLTNPEIGKLLNELEQKTTFEKLNSVQQRNILLARKAYDEATKIPEELLAALAKQRTIAVNVWRKAKTAKDWSIFEPDLLKLVDLVKQRAEILMKVNNLATPYDALIDIFEPKMNQDTIARVFSDLRIRLVPLADRCIKASKSVDTKFLKRPISIDNQRRISNAITSFIDYDIASPEAGGRIDETEHPFTTGYYSDVRITTHYYEKNFTSSLYSVLHEGGHAIYEQNYPPEWKFQPIGDAASYGIHESQSRFVENVVGRSPEFVRFFLPKINKITGGVFKDISVSDFVRAINTVKRSKIRIEADEVTYSLHVIIRFEIERDLFNGKISVKELPNIWNEKYEDYLGIAIKDDAEGALQDIHWASGYFGYFPSYALGNIYGGQFLAVMQRDLPDWQREIAAGKFSTVKQWMVDHIHQKGRLYDPEELVYKVTGERLNAQHFFDYLENKYKKLFKI